MSRKRMFHTFKEARRIGPYDEYPMLTADIDPQMHLSRSAIPQPFFLICEKDTMLAQMSGAGRIELKDSNVLFHKLEPADYVYIPAGTPSRLVPDTESVQYRYKALEPGLEGVAWYCEECGAQVYREVWDTKNELPQEAYLRICQAFNDDGKKRICPACGAEHPTIDLSPFRWAEIAAELREEQAAADA